MCSRASMSRVASEKFCLPSRGPYVAVAISTTAIALLLLENRSLPVGLSLCALLVSVGAWFAVYQEETRGKGVDIRVLSIAIGGLMLIAVALGPTNSLDVWSYTMYGRMVSQYGVSPFSHVPHDFPHDPFVHLVSQGWRHTPSVYGPVFVAYAALGSWVAGGSVLVARLFHEVGAAIAVTVALGLIWRRTRSPAAVMLLGLNPLVIVTVINGGHNDALVGLAVLGAVLLAEERKPMAAGVVLGLGVLIKVTALLALPALVAWTLYRFGRRIAGRLAGFAFASVMLGYAIVGPVAFTALDSNHTLMSWASPWQTVSALIGLDGGHSFVGLPRNVWLAAFGLGSIAIVGLLAIVVAWRRRSDSELGGVVAWAMTAYLVASIYILPWYAMWMLPAACLVRRRGTLLYVASLGGFLTAVYVVNNRALQGAVEVSWWWTGVYIGPLCLLAAFLAFALRPSDGADGEPISAGVAAETRHRLARTRSAFRS
jgi:4-amino-4-deoxy-L-arabinose transferase-like glycosyltransferase